MVEVEMARFHHALALPGQLPQHWPEVFAEFPVQGLPPILGDPDHMVLALPLGVGYALAVVHGRLLGPA